MQAIFRKSDFKTKLRIEESMIEKKNTNGLIACFGTWKDVRDDTHVQRIHNAWHGPKVTISGLGTRFGIIGKGLGGMFGSGRRSRLKEAKEKIKKKEDEYPHGISWSIVGHSRGGMIALCIAESLRLDNKQVHNLILLDPVGSFGVYAFIKIWIPSFIRSLLNIEYEQPIPDNVNNIWVLYAHGEERPPFRPTYLARSSDDQKFFRCWFEGNHADIGGYGAKETANYVGGWIRLVCDDDFGDSIVWPSEWLKNRPRDYTLQPIEYTVEQISGLKRYMPFGSYLLVVDPRSTNSDDMTIIRRVLSTR
jgi:hypothetical protein